MVNNYAYSYLGKGTGGVDFFVVFCGGTGEGAGQDSFLYVLKNIKIKKHILQIQRCKNTRYLKCMNRDQDKVDTKLLYVWGLAITR